jgi:hypothetical protein
VTEMLKNAYEQLQIFKMTSYSYHPQTLGLVEETNGTIMRMLKMLNQKEDWDVLLDEIWFYNTTPKKTFKGLYPRFLHQKMETTWDLMTEDEFKNYVATRQDLFL